LVVDAVADRVEVLDDVVHGQLPQSEALVFESRGTLEVVGNQLEHRCAAYVRSGLRSVGSGAMATREAACLCGQLRLEVEGEPFAVSICNCLDCQRRTGSCLRHAGGIQAEPGADQR
jgi:hypothetical protein